MLFNVPTGMSRFGCGTVTRPGFSKCLNWTWLPFVATSNQPSASKAVMISPLFIAHQYTSVCINAIKITFRNAPFSKRLP